MEYEKLVFEEIPLRPNTENLESDWKSILYILNSASNFSCLDDITDHKAFCDLIKNYYRDSQGQKSKIDMPIENMDMEFNKIIYKYNNPPKTLFDSIFKK